MRKSLFRVVAEPLSVCGKAVSAVRKRLFCKSDSINRCRRMYIYALQMRFRASALSGLRFSAVNIFYRQEAFRRSSVCVVRSRESGDGMISDVIGVNVC